MLEPDGPLGLAAGLDETIGRRQPQASIQGEAPSAEAEERKGRPVPAGDKSVGSHGEAQRGRVKSASGVSAAVENSMSQLAANAPNNQSTDVYGHQHSNNSSLSLAGAQPQAPSTVVGTPQRSHLRTLNNQEIAAIRDGCSSYTTDRRVSDRDNRRHIHESAGGTVQVIKRLDLDSLISGQNQNQGQSGRRDIAPAPRQADLPDPLLRIR